MTKILTIAEIEKRYGAEWILVADPVTDAKTLAVTAGRVLFHSKDRDEVHRRLLEIRPRHFALLRVGKRRKDVVFAL